MDLEEYLNLIITVFQIMIAAGIVFRVILVIQKGRDEGCSWKQIFNQIRKFILIGGITITIAELVKVFEGYFKES